jgi:hypothetical protein
MRDVVLKRVSFWQLYVCQALVIALVAPSQICAQRAKLVPESTTAKPTIDDPEVIVVVARKRGVARGNPKPIEVIDEQQLQSLRGLPISEIVKRLSRDGQANPRILISGRPADTTISVSGLPSEAIARIEILPPETATSYGEPANGRVINIVLKSEFKSIQLNQETAHFRDALFPNLSMGLQSTNLSGDSQTSLSASLNRVAPRFDKLHDGQPSLSPISPESTNLAASIQLQRALMEATFVSFSAGLGQSESRSSIRDFSVNDFGKSTSNRANWNVGGQLSTTRPSFSYSLGTIIEGNSDQLVSALEESRGHTFNSQVTASATGTAWKFPGGSIQTALNLVWRSSSVRNTQVSENNTVERDDHMQQLDFRAGATVPWTNGKGSGPGAVSASLSHEGLNLNAAWGTSTAARLYWLPLDRLSLEANTRFDRTPPTQSVLARPIVSRQEVFDVQAGINRIVTILRDDNSSVNEVEVARNDVRINYVTDSSWPLNFSLNMAQSSDTGRFDQPDQPSDALQLRQPERYIRNNAGTLTTVDLRTRKLPARSRETIGIFAALSIPLSTKQEPPETSSSQTATQAADAIMGSQSILDISIDSQWLLPDLKDQENDGERLGEPINRTVLRAEYTKNRSRFLVTLDRTSSQLSREASGQLSSLPSKTYAAIELSGPLTSMRAPKILDNVQIRASLQNYLLGTGKGNRATNPQNLALLLRQRPLTASIVVAFTF